MYAFPHERSDLQTYMFAETPRQLGGGVDGSCVVANVPALWRFEVSVSEQERFVPESEGQVTEMVNETSVLVMTSDCSEQELMEREVAAKKEVAKAVLALAWQLTLRPALQEHEFDTDRLFMPPNDVLELRTDSGSMTVFNFGEMNWDEGHRAYFDMLFTGILSARREQRQLNECPALIVLPSSKNVITKVALLDPVLILGERVLAIDAPVLAEMIGGYITERSTTGDQLANMRTTIKPYKKPWGIRKPDLITLL